MADHDPDQDQGEGSPAARNGRSTLVFAPAEGDGACPAPPIPDEGDGVNALCVSFSGEPTARLDDLARRGTPLARTGVVVVGDDDVDAREPDLTVAVERLESVDALSELGTRVRNVTREWAEDDVPTVLCFDSVDDLLAIAGVELAFEFLLVLVEGIRPAGVVSHFHFDPDAHEGTSQRTIRQLFDDEVEAPPREPGD